MFSLNYWIAQIVGGSAGINDLVSGKRNFSDPQIVEAIQQWTQLAQYSMPGTATTTGDQAYQFLFQGKAAMTITGPWPFYDMRKAFETGDLSYASALSVILLIVVSVISWIQIRVLDTLGAD